MRYPTQRHRILVDNGGLGPAVSVRIPYNLTVFDIDELGTSRVDDLASQSGEFVVLHVPAGAQKISDLILDTTYFPSFKLELGAPVVLGLDSVDYSKNWTDAGSEFRTVEVHNKELWDSLRSAIWIPSRPTQLDLRITGAARREQSTLVLPLMAAVKNVRGEIIPQLVSVWVISGPDLTLGPFSLTSGAPQELRLGSAPSGVYEVLANVQSLVQKESIVIP